MALPRIIEYLLSLQRPGGSGALVYQGAFQTIVPVMPPHTQIVLESYPLWNDYIDIMYNAGFDPMIVPNAFYAWGSYFGNRTYEGIVLPWWLNNTIESFIIVTPSEPAVAYILNRSPLTQMYAAIANFIAIATVDDFNIVLGEIKNMATSSKSDELAQDANNLLKQLVKVGRA